MKSSANVVLDRRPMARPGGFTLIELLVVIAIVAVLASLLLPLLARAKASALSVKCKSNLHQVGLGLLMYVDDYGVYPQNSFASAPASDWAAALNTILRQPFGGEKYFPNSGLYTKWSGGIFLCPADNRTIWHGYGGSYGYNAVGVVHSGVVPDAGNSASSLEPLGLAGRGRYQKTTGPSYPEVVHEANVRVPSEMMAIGDAYGVSNLPPGSWKLDVMDTPGVLIREDILYGLPQDPRQATGRKRHQGRLNVVFCDGHVEALKVQSMFFGKTDRDLRIWNVDNEPHRERLSFTK